MKPLSIYFKNCNKDLAYLFNEYLRNLEETCRNLFFARFRRSAKIVILDMEFTGFYEPRVLNFHGIPLSVGYVEWDDNSARIYNEYKKIIELWEELSQYRSILKFIEHEELFLRVLDNVDTLKKVVDSKRLDWLMRVEEDFNVFKATKLIEGL